MSFTCIVVFLNVAVLWSSLFEDKLRVEGRMDFAEARRRIDFVKVLQRFLHVVLNSGECSDDSRRPESMRYHREMGEMPLDAGIQNRLRIRVA